MIEQRPVFLELKWIATAVLFCELRFSGEQNSGTTAEQAVRGRSCMFRLIYAIL